METTEANLEAARATLDGQPEARDEIDRLEGDQERMRDKIDRLYASLNVGDNFPELQGIDIGFIRILLIMRDLKIHIRKSAIGNFFEWDRLNQAAYYVQAVLEENELAFLTSFAAMYHSRWPVKRGEIDNLSLVISLEKDITKASRSQQYHKYKELTLSPSEYYHCIEGRASLLPKFRAPESLVRLRQHQISRLH